MYYEASSERIEQSASTMYYAMRLYAQLPFPVAASYFRGRMRPSRPETPPGTKSHLPKLFTGTPGLHYPIV